jgi:uncharacterized cupredoxin-like copper-binding protein
MPLFAVGRLQVEPGSALTDATPNRDAGSSQGDFRLCRRPAMADLVSSMDGHAGTRRSLAFVVVAAGLLLTGCGSTGTSNSSGMGGAGGGNPTNGSGMGGAGGGNPANGSGMGGSGGGNPGNGSPMMSSGSQYHYSALTCSAPKSLPGHTVSVTLADMGMTSMMGGTAPLGVRMMLRAGPATVPAGVVSLVASNVGWRTHELIILPLPANGAAGQRTAGPDGKVTETGSLGEASGSCAGGTGKGIAARTVSWTTVKLPAGRYELVCNLANHYADGMHQELVVT